MAVPNPHRNEYVKALQRKVGPALFNLLTNTPQEEEEIGPLVLAACDETLRASNLSGTPRLPMVRRGLSELSARPAGYGYPRVLGLEHVAESGLTASIAARGRQRRYEITCEVTDANDQPAANFSGVVDRGRLLGAEANISNGNSADITGAIGYALTSHRMSVPDRVTYTAWERDVEFLEQGYRPVWVNEQGEQASGQ